MSVVLLQREVLKTYIYVRFRPLRCPYIVRIGNYCLPSQSRLLKNLSVRFWFDVHINGPNLALHTHCWYSFSFGSTLNNDSGSSALHPVSVPVQKNSKMVNRIVTASRPNCSSHSIKSPRAAVILTCVTFVPKKAMASLVVWPY